jgi:nucleoside phosphorylase
MKIPPSNADIVVISILPKLELRSILSEFEKRWPKAEISRMAGSTTLFRVKNSKGFEIKIAVRAIHDAGNLSSAIETTNMLSRFFPRFAFLCGIAGNLNHDKRQLGDVVVSSSYTYKAFTRMSANKKLEATYPNGPTISRQFRERAASFFADNEVDLLGPEQKKLLGKAVLKKPNVVESGKIFCWDLVLDCNETRQELITQDREFRAVEMEIYGFLKSIEAFGDLHEHPVHGLAFRGLSDPASGKQSSDASDVDWRKLAALNAARSLAHFIDDLSEEDCVDTRF